MEPGSSLTGNSASTSDFYWNEKLIRVSQFALVMILYIDIVMPAVFTVEWIVLLNCICVGSTAFGLIFQHCFIIVLFV